MRRLLSNRTLSVRRAVRFIAMGFFALGSLSLGLFSSGSLADAAEMRLSTGDLDPHREASRYVESALDAAAEGDALWHARLIAEALEIAPDYAPARWQSGQVRVGNEWLTIKAAEKQAAANSKLRQYDAIRSLIESLPAADEELARWCRKNELRSRERLHWYRVLHNNPQHKEALNCLDVRWYQGQLLAREEVKQRKKEDQATRRCERDLKREIARWLKDIAGGSNSADEEAVAKKSVALANILELNDVRMIPLLEARLSGRNPEVSLALIESVSRLDAPQASMSLARHAVLSPFESVRESATDALVDRPIYDYFPMLLGELKPTVKTDFSVLTSRDGDVRYVHEIVDESAEAKRVMTLKKNLSQLDLRNGPARTTIINENSGEIRTVYEPVLARNVNAVNRTMAYKANTFRRLFSSQALGLNDRIENENLRREQTNRRIIAILTKITERDHGTNIRDWWDWWRQHNELYVTDKPVYEETKTSTITKVYYTPPEQFRIIPKTPPPPPPLPPGSYSCFAAGTPVWTQTGQRPIESIKPGDWVLAQNVESGELAYKPVFDTTLRPATEILAIHVEGQTISSTLGHPFWVEGKGWRMAKELKTSDSLHTVTGPARILSIEPGENAEAHNLVVAEFENYFVGASGILVHDYNFRKPTRAVVPGLVVNKILLRTK